MFSIRRIGALGRTYRHVNRYQRIIRVLFKYGFADVVERLNIDQYLEIGLQMISRKPRSSVQRFSRPERLRMALEELGPTFIKLGQLLSTRPDFVAPDYLRELTRLQDSVPSFSYDEVKDIFQQEFGRNPEEIFLSFQKDPIAAASIGQVHRAILVSGEEVVVKVQRPGIRRIIEVDLEILLHIASLMEEHLEELQGHRPVEVVAEFSRSLSREIDFNVELASIERFARQFSSNREIHVPVVYPEFSCGKILVMEYIDGVKANDLPGLRRQGNNLKLVAQRGARLVMEQVFVHGFFHADPHPGNVLVMKDNVVCFIDFGQMGRLSRKDREDFTDLVLHVVKGDERQVAAGVLKLTVQHGEVDREELGRDLGEFMDMYVHKKIGDIAAEKILNDIILLVARHGLALRPNLYLMMKALATVEGLGLKLDPELKLINLAGPFMRKVKMGQFNPGRVAEEVGETGSDYLHLFRELPEDLRVIIHLLKSGRLHLEFEHKGLQKLGLSLDRVSGRISFAIVLAAQIIGSSLIVLSGIPPRWHDIPIIGLVGFVVAGVMGIWLLVSIIRHGKM